MKMGAIFYQLGAPVWRTPYKTCKHLIATLYKNEYAHTKRRCNLACTETACQWNKGTRKELEPKRITDLFVRKKLGSKHAEIDD